MTHPASDLGNSDAHLDAQPVTPTLSPSTWGDSPMRRCVSELEQMMILQAAMDPCSAIFCSPVNTLSSCSRMINLPSSFAMALM